MKKLLIGLLALGSMTAFASENFKLIQNEFTNTYNQVSSDEINIDYNINDIHQCVIHGIKAPSTSGYFSTFGVMGQFNTRLVAHRGGANTSCHQLEEVCTKRRKNGKCARKATQNVNKCKTSLKGALADVIGKSLSNYLIYDFNKGVFRSEEALNLNKMVIYGSSSYGDSRSISPGVKNVRVLALQIEKDNSLTFEIAAHNIEYSGDRWSDMLNRYRKEGKAKKLLKQWSSKIGNDYTVLGYAKCYNTGVGMDNSNPSVN